MSLYINPTHMTKEQWLRENASAITPPPTVFNDREDQLYVVHVNAGGHTAALIVTDAAELRRVTADKADRRPRQWYAVPIDILNELPGINIRT